MAAVLRILRSDSTLVRPQGRKDGEPYVNWADMQWGVWQQATGLPTDLLAIRIWSPVAAYVVNDLVTDYGRIYRCLLPHTNQPPPNNYWHEIGDVTGGGGGGFPDAPPDSQTYGRRNGAWAVVLDANNSIDAGTY